MMVNFARLAGCGVGLCFVLVGTQSAQAEPAAPAPAPAPAAAPSAPLPADVLKEAGERYARGLALYGDGEFLLALVEFERAYQLSSNYKVLYNIGQVRIQLGRYAKAKEALEEFLKVGGSSISAERTQAVNKDLAALAERTASLNVVTAQDGADISLDGKLIGTSPLSAAVIVDAGEHTLVVHKSGFYDDAQSVTLAGHDQLELKVELKPIPVATQVNQVDTRPTQVAPTQPPRTAMWVAWGTTGALAATAGIVGYLGASKAGDLSSLRNDPKATRDQLDSTRNSARTLFIVSDITTGLAVLSGGVALYLTFKHPSEKPASASVSLGIVPNGLRLRGSF
ncbi:MAG: PEGA domain-containing protein [Polyangiaceae bacterium]